MPVLLAVGSNDSSTLPEHQRILYDALPGEKEMHVIKNAGHSFYEPEEREELKKIVSHWLRTVA